MADIGTLVATLFLARDVAHREHLKTRSYSAHMALGDFYAGVIELADSLAETYQGHFNKLIDIPLLDAPKDTPIAEFLAGQHEWICDARYEAVPKDETAIQNIIDEIEALYMSTLYKLRFLS